MKRFGPGIKLSDFQIIILSFAGLIIAGALLLMLPFSARSGRFTSPDTALFTATSAVCVTGLIVRDTASYWTPFGQAVILALIQVGGVGVVTFAAAIELAGGKKLTLFERDLIEDSISGFQVGGMAKMTRFICRFVIAVELAGALILMPTFCRDFGLQGIWMSLFHSISAFCNAGFDIMGTHSGPFTSLTAYMGAPGVFIPISLLIVFGGIGFIVWKDIIAHRGHFKKYRMQSKVVLATTAVLIAVPAVLFFISEYADFSLSDRLSLSFFQAVTPRTAGFNTADLSRLTGGGVGIMIVLMLIGGSPGSTAGGMKTTTVAVLAANARTVFRRTKDVEMFGRRIEDGTVRSASALLLIYLFLSVGAAALISLIESIPLRTCLFETASAIGTVGLTLGITPSLGLISKLILIFLMFFGRVGGLTIMYAALSGRGPELSRLPVEKINVG